MCSCAVYLHCVGTLAKLCAIVGDSVGDGGVFLYMYVVLQEEITSVVSVGQFTYTGAKCRSVEEARQSAAALAVSKMTAQTKVCPCVHWTPV